MIFREPPPDLKTALERRFRLYKGCVPSSDEGYRQAIDAISGKVTPVKLGGLYEHSVDVYLYAIEWMERKPHIRKISGETVVIHDLEFADTVAFLETTFVAMDRPLIPWAKLARVLCEFLYVGAKPGLGLYFADRIDEYASRFAEEDGLYLRPIPIQGTFNDDTQVADVLQAQAVLAERKRRFMDVQRLTVLFHEIGHALFTLDPLWRDKWQDFGISEIDKLYQSMPINFDQEYGLLRKKREYWEDNRLHVEPMTDEEIERINRALMDKMVEEISCDAVALLGLVLNASSLNVSVEDAIRVLWRFMLFTDLISQVRDQVRQRVNNKIRFRSVRTKLFIRTEALLSLLASPSKMPSSATVPDVDIFRERLQSIDVLSLIDEFQDGLSMAGQLMDWAVGGPATWERHLHYGGYEGGGYLSEYQLFSAWNGTEEYRTDMFDALFGDDFLLAWIEPDVTRTAPCVRSAAHLLSRSRMWANEYYVDEEIQKHYGAMAKEEDSAILTKKLRTTFEDVTIRKVDHRFYFEED